MDGLERVGVSRRAFVAAAGSAVSLSGSWSLAAGAEPPRKIPVGVQLWTLRRELADDMPGTLRQVSKIGYDGVELWFQKWPDPRELKNVLDDCGLKIASAHVNLKDILEDFPRLRDYHRAIGNTTLVIPYIPDFAKLTPEGWRKTVDDVRLAEQALQAGVAVRPLSRYHADPQAAPRGLLLGYACVKPEDIAPAFSVLAEVIESFLSGTA